MSYSGQSKTASPRTPDLKGAPDRTAVLIVDDEADAAQLNASVLLHAGFDCRTCSSGSAALDILAHEQKDVLVADVSMPGMDGIELARQVRARWPELSVILLTAKADVEIAAAATQGSVLGYTKVPFHPPAFVDIVRRAAQMTADARHERKVMDAAMAHGVVAQSPQMIAALATVSRAAPSRASVVIEGEQGTGKTMVAALLHAWSYRSAHAMVTVDCGQLALDFNDSDLFGSANAPGPLERASGGTLLLREIATASARFQDALARVIENGEFQPASGPQRNELDVRVVATTSRILGMEVAAGRFNKSLLRHLAEVIIRIPPLRERPEAIMPLARSFISSHDGVETNHATITSSAEQALLDYEWPGNVGEMRTRLERALILCRGGEITPDLLGLNDYAHHAHEPSASHRELKGTLDSLAVARLKEVLAEAGGDEQLAAAKIGVNPAMMHRVRSRFGI